MAKYPCKFVSTFILFSMAFSLIVTSMILEGWYILEGRYSFHFDGTDHYYGYYSSTRNTVLTRSMWGCIITATTLSGLCVLLSFIMMCADCCCHITKCMTVIPKIIIIFSSFGGILAEVTCILLLLKIYVYQEQTNGWNLHISVIPSYCFYLTSVTGLFLLIASCINCGIKQTSEVEDVAQVVTVPRTQISGQLLQSQMQSNMHPPSLVPMFMPPSQAPVVYPAPRAPGYPQNGGNPWKIFVTHVTTQTSVTDLKKAAK